MRSLLVAVISLCGLAGSAVAEARQPVVACRDFVRLDDGSWHVIKDTEIDAGLKELPNRISLKAGQIIYKDGSAEGAVDENGRKLFDAIDKSCNPSNRA